MQKKPNLRVRLLVAAVAVTMMVGFTAVQGFAANQKTIGMDVSNSSSTFTAATNTMSSGQTTTMYFRLYNTSPGNSNPNSFVIGAPSGFSITAGSAAYVSGTTTNAGRSVSSTSSTITVQGLDPLKTANTSTIKPNVIVSATVTAPANTNCSTPSSGTWTVSGWTGSVNNGSPFTLQTGNVITSVTAGCGTAKAQVYVDANANGSDDDATSAADLSGFGFGLRATAAGANLQTASSNASGLATFATPVSGSFYVCQTSTPSGWVLTDPSSSSCKQITVTPSGTTARFGDAQQASVTVTKYNDANVDGSQDNNEGTLSGWQFSLMDGATQVGSSQSTGADGTTTFTGLTPGKTYSVCETDSRIDTNSAGFANDPWFNTDPGGDSACTSVSTTSGSSDSLSFGNAQGNLDCNQSITSPDGQATVERLDNLNDVPCTLKPASLDHSTAGNGDQDVTFLVTGDHTQQAAYVATINWDPIANTNPPTAVATTIDLPNGVHDLQWCKSEHGGTNGNPELPSGEVGCIVSQTWNIVDATHVAETEVIYLEADIVLSKKI